jgi:predicted SAM-dependent methyltransferase
MGKFLTTMFRWGLVGKRTAPPARRIHVGCGPLSLEGWTNVDVRPFKSVDFVLDVTGDWPWTDLEYIYGEHFIEHLDLEDAVRFLVQAGNSLQPEGILRLTTPNLAWVMATHYRKSEEARKDNLVSTLATNRAFHGWGHKFLYDRDMVEYIITQLNFAELAFFSYGESHEPALKDLEQHGDFDAGDGLPNLLVFEVKRGHNTVAASVELKSFLNEEFIKYVRAGQLP